MDTDTAKRIRAVLVLFILAASIGSGTWFFLELRKHKAVINAQGTLLRLMVETPEIEAVLTNELRRRQAESAATSTHK